MNKKDLFLMHLATLASEDDHQKYIINAAKDDEYLVPDEMLESVWFHSEKLQEFEGDLTAEQKASIDNLIKEIKEFDIKHYKSGPELALSTEWKRPLNSIKQPL